MRKTRWFELAALGVVAALTLGASSCPLIPEIKERTVELALGGSTTTQFHAQGSINTFNETSTIDLSTELNLRQIIEDAGVDVSDVQDISLAGVSYQVLQPDPEPTRQITNGEVHIARGAGAEVPLVTSFTETVNSVTSWKTAPLDAAGVALLNTFLDDLLASVKNNTAIPNPTFTYRLSGNSVPGSVETDFIWEIKVDISIVGTVTVKVPT